MADATPTAEDVQSILTTLNGMKMSVLILLATVGVSAGVMLGAFRLIVLWFTMRSERRKDEEKAARAKDWREQMEKMQASLDSAVKAMSKSTRENREFMVRTESVVETLFAAVEHTAKNVEILRRMQEGAMRPEDSFVVLRWMFLYRLKYDLEAVFSLSFKENHYEERKTHIRRKIKTKIADAILVIQQEAARLKLVIDYGCYFPAYRVEGVSRYTLCDRVWDAIMPIYKRRASLDGSKMTPDQFAVAENELHQAQIEEMEVILQNVLEEHVGAAERMAHEDTRVTGASTGYRTPVPRPLPEDRRPATDEDSGFLNSGG